MQGCRNTYFLSTVNNQEYVLKKTVMAYSISKLIQLIVMCVMNNIAQFVIINFMKEIAIKMV